MISDASKFISPSGDLFFDFVNTVVVKQGKEADLLEVPGDLFAWAVSAGLLEMHSAKGLAESAGSSPEEILDEAKGFRDILRGVAIDLSEGRPARPAAVEEINRHLRTGYGFRELVLEGSRPVMTFRKVIDEPRKLLAAVANDAATLLAEGDPSLVKQCESEECVLFFYDSTKNHSRRWCSMEGCGNREKARAYYRRKKKG